MKRVHAWLVVAATASATTATLLADWRIVLALGAAAFAGRRKGRLGLAAFALSSIAFNAVVLGLVVFLPTAGTAASVTLDADGVALGLQLGLRLASAVAVNFAVLDWFPAPVLVDGLRLPRRMTAWVAAGVLAAHAVGQDARRIALAHRLSQAPALPRGGKPGRLRRARAGMAMMPALLVAGLRRAQVRREALRLAGHEMGSAFTPIIAVAALAAAGRLAFAAIPNVAPTYVVVFLGGVLFGPAVGAAAGALTMAATNVALTGLLPMPFASNVPAMAALGAAGGWLRHHDWQGSGRADRAAGRILAGVIGALATIAFSVIADLGTWAYAAVLQHMQAQEVPAGSLPRLIAVGLAFNAIPAAVNAVVFASAVPAVVRVWRILRQSEAGAPAPRPGGVIAGNATRPGVSPPR